MVKKKPISAYGTRQFWTQRPKLKLHVADIKERYAAIDILKEHTPKHLLYTSPELIVPKKMSPAVLQMIIKGHVYEYLTPAQKGRLTEPEIVKLEEMYQKAINPTPTKSDLVSLGQTLLDAHPSYSSIDSIEISSPIKKAGEEIIKVKRDVEGEFKFLNIKPKVLDGAFLADVPISAIERLSVIPDESVANVIKLGLEMLSSGGKNIDSKAAITSLLEYSDELQQLGGSPLIKSFMFDDKRYLLIDQIPMIQDSNGIFVGISQKEFSDAMLKTRIAKRPIETNVLSDIFFINKKDKTQKELFEKYGFIPNGGVGIFLKGFLPKNLSSDLKFSKIRSLPGNVEDEFIEIKMPGDTKQTIKYPSTGVMRAKSLLGEDASLYQTDMGFLVAYIPSSPRIKIVIPPVSDLSGDSVDFENILSFKGVKIASKDGTTRDDLPKTLKKKISSFRKKSPTKESADILELLALELYDSKTNAKDIIKLLNESVSKSKEGWTYPKNVLADPVKIIKAQYENELILKVIQEQKSDTSSYKELEHRAQKLAKDLKTQYLFHTVNENRIKLGLKPVPGRQYTLDVIRDTFADIYRLHREANLLQARERDLEEQKLPYHARRRLLKDPLHAIFASKKDDEAYLKSLKRKIKDPVLKKYLMDSIVEVIDVPIERDGQLIIEQREVNLKGVKNIYEQRLKNILKKTKDDLVEAKSRLESYTQSIDPFDELTGDDING